MAKPPVVKDQFTSPLVVLNLQSVGLTDEQFYWLCGDNPELRFELSAQKKLIIMPPTGLGTGWRNAKITQRLANWSESDGTGLIFDSSTLFTLPNGAKRSPDAAWVRRERWEALGEEEQERFALLCPDFVVELRSVYIHRPGEAVESLENPANISGDPVLPGFVLNLLEIW